MGYGDSWFQCSCVCFRCGMSIAGAGADRGCSGRGDLDDVLDIRLPDGGAFTAGAELGDVRPDSGSAGELEPDTDALFVRRQRFLMLFTLIIEFVFCLATPFPSSEASESIENRLDGAPDKWRLL